MGNFLRFIFCFFISVNAIAQEKEFLNYIDKINKKKSCVACGVGAFAGKSKYTESSVLSHSTKLTGYYPNGSAMEGGYLDSHMKKLNTLQDFLEGKAPYVSVAIDNKGDMLKYQKSYFCIPQMESAYAKEMSENVKKKYNGHIIFKAVDTGGKFYYKKWGKMDICVRNKAESLRSTLNKIESATVIDCNNLATSNEN